MKINYDDINEEKKYDYTNEENVRESLDIFLTLPSNIKCYIDSMVIDTMLKNLKIK